MELYQHFGTVFHYSATELTVKTFTDVCPGDNCLLNLLALLVRNVGSIQKVGVTCIQGHPHKQKLTTFYAVKGHFA